MTSRELVTFNQIAKLFDVDLTSDISQIKSRKLTSTTSMLECEVSKNYHIILLTSNIINTKSEVIKSLPIEYRSGAEVINNLEGSGFSINYKQKHAYYIISKSPRLRLDSLLADKYKNLSRSTLQKHIKDGLVRVNSEVVKTPSRIVQSTDNVDLKLKPSDTKQHLHIEVLYKDNDVMVLEKPNGMLTHSKGALSDEFTLADYLRQYTTYNSNTNRPGIVHRLDRDTSGVIIGVLNETAAKYIQRQFSSRTVKKTYYALVQGRPRLERALIDLPIERNPKKPSTFRVGPRGKQAQTEYEVVNSNDYVSLVRLEPKSGRTHQLRVHMAHIGNPIIGDRVYGKASDRLYLHASRLELTLPGGNRKVFESMLPKEFKVKMDQL